MPPGIADINSFLNSISGLLGVLGIAISIMIAWKTIAVKRTVERMLNRSAHKKDRDKAVQRLRGLSDSVSKDELLDLEIKKDLFREINYLKELDFFCSVNKQWAINRCIKRITSILKADTEPNRQNLVSELEKLLAKCAVTEQISDIG